MAQLDVQAKLAILADAAKYDASCASSGTTAGSLPARGGVTNNKHPTKPGRVTVAGGANDDLAPGTLNSMLKQAGLRSPSGA